MFRFAEEKNVFFFTLSVSARMYVSMNWRAVSVFIFPLSLIRLTWDMRNCKIGIKVKLWDHIMLWWGLCHCEFFLFSLLRFFFLSWSSFFTVWLRVLICRPGWVFFYLVEVVCLVEVSYLVEVADGDWREVDLAYRAGCVADRDRGGLLDVRTC